LLLLRMVIISVVIALLRIVPILLLRVSLLRLTTLRVVLLWVLARLHVSVLPELIVTISLGNLTLWLVVLTCLGVVGHLGDVRLDNTHGTVHGTRQIGEFPG